MRHRIAFHWERGNIIPVISLEGYEADTDARRGDGIHSYLIKVLKKLKDRGLFFGTSLTVTKKNFSTLTSDAFIQQLTSSGPRLVFFVEYVPVKEGTEGWVLTQDQCDSIPALMESFRKRFPGVFVAFPGDEKALGGCVSSGRGFVHVAPDGSLEPCPFAPYSDTNLKNVSFAEGLQSRFLSTIRQNYKELSEGPGGCALWHKREWVRSLLS